MENFSTCVNCDMSSLSRVESAPPMRPRANARQIGGNHYKGTHTGAVLEHWDIVAMFGLDYFQGQVTKYIMRWKMKGGLDDLRKAEHFLQKYIEIEEAKARMAEYDPLGKMEADNAVANEERRDEAVSSSTSGDV